MTVTWMPQVAGATPSDGVEMRIEHGRVFDLEVAAKGPEFDFDRIEGMLLGVAIGDSLGNTTEAMLPFRRRQRHGEIRDYLESRHAPGAVGVPSDDTQLTFWTLKRLSSEQSTTQKTTTPSRPSLVQRLGRCMALRGYQAGGGMAYLDGQGKTMMGESWI